MKTKLIFLFLIGFTLAYAQENNEVKREKWRLNLSGGLGYLLGSTEKAEKELSVLLVDPAIAGDYYSQMKWGTQANADLHYLFRPNMGAGICYSLFTTSPSEKNVIFNVYDGVHYQVGDLSEKIYVNYVGPSFLMKEFINKQQTWSTSVMLSLGYAFYRNEAKLINSNLLNTGGNFATNMNIGIEYMVAKNLAIGVDAGAFFSSLSKAKVDNGTTSVEVDLKENKENLTRLNLSLCIRLYK